MKPSSDMTTTNLRLPRAQLKHLKRLALEHDTSVSRLIRDALAEFIERRQTPLSPAAYKNDPLFGLGKRPGHSGLGDLAEQHNKYLYGRR